MFSIMEKVSEALSSYPEKDLIRLRLLKSDRLANPFGYMAAKYLTDYGIGEMTGIIVKLGTDFFENSGSVSLALTI